MTRSGLTLINMSGAIGMIMIDQTVIGIAIPALQRSFDFGPLALQWVVNGYTLALAASLICAGWAGDRFGHYRSFAAGVALFTGSSLLCALAPVGEIFILARIGQGVGASLMQPAATAIVFGTFPPKERGKAMSIYVGSGLLFLAAGPLLGGILVERFSWHMVFLVNLPIGCATLLAALRLGREAPKGTEKPFDFMGATLLVSGIFFLTTAIQSLGDGGAVSLLSLALAAIGLGCLIALPFRKPGHGAPIIDFGNFRNKIYLGCGIVLFCIQFAMLGQVVFGAVFIQNVLAFSPFQTGLAMMPVVLAIILMAQVSGYLFDKVSFRLLAVSGTLAISLGFFSQALVLELGHILWMIPGMLLIGLGLGLLASTVTTEGLSQVPMTQRATASAILQTLRQTGGVFGIACIGSVINLIEKTRIEDIAQQLEPVADKRRELQLLLFQSEQSQAKATAQLKEHWPEALADLKQITAEAIAAGYYLGAAVVFLAAVISLWAFAKTKKDAAEESAS
ncbi:DHA2 family efflux MFS transporter permease subunit [Labrenzia sp. PHM005]|uniref:DHA2 family efflux MFS transporter permease subunit n=1 Tax=Labrenzia sp. PHM005 TaxID=2590016 RepID=UPI001140456C|nr:DHA2 family efflux MFS transporter permease subunit [Labrenzia sp. PHM005]QDG79005.1 DHA2 family efflux MFS transporter permease subunit [Labrenzia sp. PHM005]